MDGYVPRSLLMTPDCLSCNSSVCHFTSTSKPNIMPDALQENCGGTTSAVPHFNKIGAFQDSCLPNQDSQCERFIKELDCEPLSHIQATNTRSEISEEESVYLRATTAERYSGYYCPMVPSSSTESLRSYDLSYCNQYERSSLISGHRNQQTIHVTECENQSGCTSNAAVQASTTNKIPSGAYTIIPAELYSNEPKLQLDRLYFDPLATAQHHHEEEALPHLSDKLYDCRTTFSTCDIPKNNVCRVCGKAYARPSTLKTHMRTHSGERPYRCLECCKTFSQAANLTAHERTHSGEKPFRCPICDRCFSQSSSVTTHIRTHSGDRPYRCKMCKKSFSDSSTLTKHMRTHSGEKPYQCGTCLLRFSQSGNLNRHMRVHSAH